MASKSVKITRQQATSIGLSSTKPMKNVGCRARGRFTYKNNGTGQAYYPTGEQALLSEERGRR